MARIDGGRQSDVALVAGVNQATVSRWLRKGGTPDPENAMALSRAVGDSPITGLLAAGLLREDEVDGVVRVAGGLSEVRSEALLAELGRRLGVHVDSRKERAG